MVVATLAVLSASWWRLRTACGDGLFRTRVEEGVASLEVPVESAADEILDVCLEASDPMPGLGTSDLQMAE